MKELEDTKCEIRRTIDLQFSIWDRLNASSEDEGASSLGTQGYNGCANPLGNFFDDASYAWLSRGPRLVVVNVKTGAAIGSWTFRDRVTCVSQFPARPGQIPLLLVGLDNEASKVRDSLGHICVFDCTTSQVLRAIRMPAGVEQTCVASGGAEWENFDDPRMGNVLGGNSGIACVALRNLDHLMIDLRRESWDNPEATVLADEASPAELNFGQRNEAISSRQRSGREKHAAYNLMNSRLEEYIGFNREDFESSSIYQETLTSSLICSRKIGCLVSGCLGRIIIWQTDGDVRWISAPLDESMSITHLTLLEPTDDPRPFCYLWSAYQEETRRSPPLLRMHAMLFERKYSEKGANAYYNLEADPSVKFELELDDNDRVTSLCAIIRESNHEQTDSSLKRGEESILLISLETRAILFDLNQWYKEQMPRNLEDCNNPNAFVAHYRTRNDTNSPRDDNTMINCAYVPSTIGEFPSNGPAITEELFFPNSLCLDWIELGTSRLVFRSTRGLQAELLREISLTGPLIMIEPAEMFDRCVSAGLIVANCDVSRNLEKSAQREHLLSLCLEQRWSKFLLRCAKEWSDGSAAYLFHEFLSWGMQRASWIKLTADRLSVPLYDQSGACIGESEIKQLRFYCQQLDCIASVFTNIEADSVDLTRKKHALRRVSAYLHVLLWFYDVGLLPEMRNNENEASLEFSLGIPYPYERLATLYREKRAELRLISTKNSLKSEEDLFIDELVTRECNPLKSQWERESDETSNDDGYYPPSSLQSLVRSFLTDCHRDETDNSEIVYKHQITIYLLMDLAMLLKNSCPAIGQLIKYPSAFKLSPSLIKLTQAMRLLDHEDYHGFLDMMTGQLVADSDVKDWHHRLVMRTLMRNNRNKLALIYLRVRKPPLSSLDEQSTVISLTVEHGLVQSAFHRRPPNHYAQLLTAFYRACKKYDRLRDILNLALDRDEEQVFVSFLENEKIIDTSLLYYLQRCRYAEAGKICHPVAGTSGRTNYTRNSDKTATRTIFNAYSATLPDITRKFAVNIVGRGAKDGDSSSRYPRPMSHRNSREKTRDIHEFVMRKARETFSRCEKSRVPFVSAPCCEFGSQHGNAATSSVLFVERMKRTRRGKRSLDEMRGDDSTLVESDDYRKRRRIGVKAIDEIRINAANDRESDSGMNFYTPPVKRKNIITRDTRIETPHSILKIRQSTRDSNSPRRMNGSSGTIAEEKIHDRTERKRRQIRFSLGQQRRTNDASELIDDEKSSDDDAEISIKRDENYVNMENPIDLAKDEISEEEELGDVCCDSNVCEKSYNEAAQLADASSISVNVSGPRPRPSLRRSNDSGDKREKSFVNKNLSIESVTSELSFERSEATKYNATDMDITGVNDKFSETAYTASILSSDTSLECTLPKIWTSMSEKLTTTKRRTLGENSCSFYGETNEKSRDMAALTSFGNEMRENFRRFSRDTLIRSSTRKSNVFEEYTRGQDDDKNSEIIMEVDCFGLDRESSNPTPTKYSSETENTTSDRMNSDEATARQKVGKIRENEAEKVTFREMNENDEIEQNYCNSLLEVSPRLRGFYVNEKIDDKVEDNDAIAEDKDQWRRKDEAEIRENKNNEDGIGEIVDVLTRDEDLLEKNDENDETEMIDATEDKKSTDDYDDELLALRYEEEEDNDENVTDDDEDYHSVTNSMENVAPRLSSEGSIVTSEVARENVKKFADSSLKNGFYEVPRVTCQDGDITDDESSRSVDGSALSANSRFELEKTLSVDKVQPDILNEASNITNDDSSSSFDSSLFSVKKPSRSMTRATNSTEKISRDDSSRGSSLFSSEAPRNIVGDASRDGERKNTSSSKKSRLDSSAVEEALESKKNDKDKREMLVDSMMTKDNEESRIKASPSRSRRNEKTIARIDETKGSVSPAMEMKITTPLRTTRTRRASSIVQEKSPVPESPATPSRKIGRPRRASSLAKDFVVATEEKLEPDISRLRGSISLAKEAIDVKSREIEESAREREEETEATPVGRRTRRAASVRREIVVPARKKITRSSSKISLSEDNIDESSTSRRTATRANKSATARTETETSNASKRLTRASSLSKETLGESNDEAATALTRRTTRKRGNSLPKETIGATSARTVSRRLRRGGSVSEDVIPEETSETAEDTRSGEEKTSSREKTAARTKSSSPATSTRGRLSSISSLPEDEADNEKKNEDKESSDEIFTSRGKSTEKNKIDARLRRAASLDLPRVAVKRLTRAASLKSTIIDEPIEEETSDIDETFESKKKLSKRAAPVRRKRAASASATSDNADEIIFEKLPHRRTRKLSQKSNDGENFSFSPPGKIHDRPDSDDEKGIAEVPDYVFSPPHTRSRLITPQPRRKMNRDFIPLTEQERAAGKRAIEGFVSRPLIKLTGHTRDPFDLYGPRKIFSIPKRSKSLTEDPTGSSQQDRKGPR